MPSSSSLLHAVGKPLEATRTGRLVPALLLLLDRDLERGAGQGKRAADRQRLVVQPLRVPFLDVEIEAGSQRLTTLASLS